MKQHVEFIDNNDELWIWDGERVYSVLAENEFIEQGIDVEENGYPASSAKQAEEVLVDGGYLGDEE